MGMKFYRCAHCGQIVAIVKGTGVPIMCCGEKMQEIVPGTTDAALEKHVPVWVIREKHSSRVMHRRHAFRSAKAMRLLPYTNTATFTACGKLDNID